MSQSYEVGVRLNADGSGLVNATKLSAAEMDKFEASAKKAGLTLEQMAAKTAAYNGTGKQVAQTAEDEAKAIAKLDAELEALLGRLNPAQRASNQLADAQGVLTRSVHAGLLSQQQYNEAMTQASSMYAQSADGLEKAAAGAEKGAFATAGARRELIVLGHEAVTGNFSRMPGSFMVLTERVGASGLALTGIVGAIAAVAGGALVLGKAFADGHKEMTAMNNALAISGDFAGQTRGTMRELALQIASTGTMTVGTAKSIVTELVASGQIGAVAIGNIARLASNYASATGKDIDKIAPELVRLFEDPVKGAAELNRQMHMLSSSDQERIAHLVRLGQEGEAQLLLAQKATDLMPKIQENLGSVERGWDKLKAAASGAWDAFLGIGREQTLEEKLVDAQKILDAKIRAASPGPGPASPATVARLTASSQGDKDLAAYNLYSAAEGQVAQTSASEQNALDNKAASLVRQTSEYYKIAALQDQIKVASQFDAKTLADKVDKARTLTVLGQQQEALAVSAGARGRALAVEGINYVLKSREVTLAMANEKNDLALKLGQIDQAEHDRRKLFLDLEKNAIQQNSTQAQKSAGAMTDVDRQRLANVLKLLGLEGQLIQMKGDDKQTLDASKAAKAQEAIIDSMIDGVNKLGDAEVKRLTASIAAERLHNDEIGKTKEQIDRMKATNDETHAASLQGQADEIQAMLSKNELLIEAADLGVSALAIEQHAINIYTAQLEQLKAQIPALRERASVMRDGSAAQQQADYTKAQADDYKRLWNTVEQTGKTVFTHLLSDGKGAFESIGKALKASVIDLLYQMTVRPFIVQIGASIAGSMGIAGAANAAGTAGGLGNGLSLASGANSLYNFATTGGPIGAATAAYTGVTGAVATEGAMYAVAGTAAEGAAAAVTAGLSAIGPVGWAAIAAMAVLSMSGDGGGPKASDASLRRRSDVSFGVEMNNVAGGDPDMSQVLAMNAALNDPSRFDPSKLAGLANTQVGTGSPADTATLLNQLAVALGPAAAATQAMTAATVKLTDAQIANQRQALQDQLDQLTMTQAQLLEKQRNALDESNRALFDQVQAATAAAKADQEAADRAARLASERQGLQDQFDQLTMTSAQLLGKQRDALDESNRALFDQVQAATASAQAVQAAAIAQAKADQEAADRAARLASERQGLQDQFDQLTMTSAQLLGKQRDALDESNRALFDQVQAATAATAAAQAEAAAKEQAAQEATARAAQIVSERRGLRDQLDQLTMTSTQLLEKQRNALDESNRALFDQVQAATASAQATQAAAANTAQVANERYSLETQLLQLQGNTTELRARELAKIDASNRAIQEQIYATQDLTIAQQNQASSATALASAESSLTSTRQSIESAVSSLPGKLGIDVLQRAQQGLAVSDYNAPLDRIAAARSLLDSTYASATGGDLAAVQAFPQQLQDALSIARDTFASGPQFQEIFLDGNRKLNDLLTHQQDLQTELLRDVPMTIQQASNDQIAVMRTELRALGAKLDSLNLELRRLAA